MAPRRIPLDEHGPGAIRILSIEELETGLRLLGRGDSELNAFWDQNVDAFRRTVLFAIRETSDAMLSPKITLHWRNLLQRQLESLVQYVEIADRYILRRQLRGGRRRSTIAMIDRPVPGKPRDRVTAVPKLGPYG